MGTYFPVPADWWKHASVEEMEARLRYFDSLRSERLPEESKPYKFKPTEYPLRDFKEEFEHLDEEDLTQDELIEKYIKRLTRRSWTRDAARDKLEKELLRAMFREAEGR